MQDVLAGIYRHYKGPLYLVLGVGHDANADSLYYFDAEGDLMPVRERTVVVYVGLQLDGAHLGPRLAVRTLKDLKDEFLSEVEFEGKRVPRFEYLGPALTTGMLQQS